MSGMLFLMLVQGMFQFGAKEGNGRAITWKKIILTCLVCRFKAIIYSIF